ncbi:histamine N-methyltransferase-like [Asterias rubens]|uniref:histamine N-methyltransferase-like n=1 Tax=Asterias rubens TaxID=7604 RepID=UPI001455AB15|nr:histamine N-methyltransferase-like [Asterias rubens]
MDSKILMKLHQREQRRIHAVIVEPNAPMMERYKALVVKESEMMRGIDFEWRQETLEGFQKSQNGVEDKFHFIVSVSSIYYIDDKERYIQYMYDILEDDGVLMITIMSGDTPPSCWTAWLDLKYVESSQRQEPLLNSCDLARLFENLSIPVSEIVHLKYSVNVTPCFASPLDNLSEEANRVLDFLTHVDGFTQNTPVEYQESFLEILGSEDQTERDASGQFLLGQDHVVFIIRGTGST